MAVEEIVKYIVLATILLVAMNFIFKMLIEIKYFLSSQCEEYKFRNQAKQYLKQKEKERKKKDAVPLIYFGLFQFVFENCNDEEAVKKEYCSMIKEKMQSKYKNTDLKLNATDKVFFNGRDFSNIDDLVDDFIKLYSFFENINKKRNIKTSLKFSLWTKPGTISTQNAFKVLSEMNNLDYTNQVIANDELYAKYKTQKIQMFNFHPLGIIKLIENDEDLELFRLIKK